MDERELAAIEEEMPKPTIWPAALAIGLVAACFGMITVGIFFYAGVILVAIAVWGWMRQLIRSQQSSADSRPPAPDSARAGGLR